MAAWNPALVCPLHGCSESRFSVTRFLFTRCSRSCARLGVEVCLNARVEVGVYLMSGVRLGVKACPEAKTSFGAAIEGAF